MGTDIDIRIKQDFINLKSQASPPGTDKEGIFFLNELDQKPKYRAPQNGQIYNITMTEYRGKALPFSSFNDTNGLAYWVGTDYGKREWQNPSNNGLVINNSSSAYLDVYVDHNILLGREDCTYSTFDYSDSYLGIYSYSPEGIMVNGVFIQSANTDMFGFPLEWALSINSPLIYGGEEFYRNLDFNALNGVNNKIFIPITNPPPATRAVYINHLGLNSLGTHNLALGQIELYGTLL